MATIAAQKIRIRLKEYDHDAIDRAAKEIVETAERIAKELAEAGLRVLFDDRKSSPGVKFADAELIGVPTILVVGRGLANGQVEVKDRRTGARVDVAVDSVVRQLVDMSRGQ